MSRPGSLIQFLALGAYAVANSLSGAILCVGGDGHLSIERADASCCARESMALVPGPRTQAALVSVLGRTADDCRSCVDFAFLGGSDQRRGEEQDRGAAPGGGFLSCHATLPAPCQRTERSRPPESPPRLEPRLAQIRSVVLLC